MILKLLLTKQSDPSVNEEMEFSRFPVFIGRDSGNEVILPDPFKIISRKHAKIINTEGILQLVDMESPNFTYLNEQKIEPLEENALQSNDKIKIGDYEIEVTFVMEPSSPVDDIDDQKTMVFSSPFADEVAAVAENLKMISSKYEFDDSPMKEDMLRFSILQSLGGLPKNEVNKILAEFFVENVLGKEFVQHTAMPEKKKQEEYLHEPEKTGKIQQKGKIYEHKDNPAPSADYSFNVHFTAVIDVLLEVLTKLVQGFLQFRQEFFGVTIYHTIPTGSLNEIKEFLFNPGISPEEEKKRLDLLRDEIQKLITHQIGLLEGYRISITEGSQALLQSLNPEEIEKEIASKNQHPSGLDIGKIIPFAQKAKILDGIKENYRKYISDPYHVEKKYFRPSFLKGYQKRILSKNSDNEY